MSEALKGVVAMTLACAIWGFSALFYRLLIHVPPIEVMAHRSIWGLACLVLWLAWCGRLREWVISWRNRRDMAILVPAAFLIATNWFAFVLAVQVDMLVESSLGYYIFPLVAVFLGWVFLGERLSRLQYLSVFLALLAVVQLTYGMGTAPYLSLFLAITFGLYGLLKKPVAAGPVLTVATEAMIITPFALVWVIGAHFGGWLDYKGQAGGFFNAGTDGVLLVLCGPMTTVPLVMMSYAIKRLRFSTVGLVTYVNPTIQFIVGVWIFGEAITTWHIAAFVLIWIGLTIYSWDSFRRDKSAS